MPNGESLFETSAEAEAFSEVLSRDTGWVVEYRVRASSTNELALSAAKAGEAHGRTFVTDEQTAGRGQRGRAWQSPAFKSLLFSTVVRGPGLTPERMGWVALCSGLACVEALRAETDIALRLKWPNDLVVSGGPERHVPWRKTGGILVESLVTERLKADYAVVGIGVNVNQQQEEFPADARTPPVSLRLLAGRTLDRRALLSALLRRLSVRFGWVLWEGAFEAAREDVRTAFEGWWRGWRLRMRVPDGEYIGLFKTLSPHGRLELIDRMGRTRTFSDAEWLAGAAAEC